MLQFEFSFHTYPLATMCVKDNLQRLSPPGFRGERLELLDVIRIEIDIYVLFTHCRKKRLRQHCTNGVDGFMPIEPFAHQPKKYGPGLKWIPECDLILDDHVYCSVNSLIRKLDSLSPVVSDDQPRTLGLVEREPAIGIDVLVRVVPQQRHETLQFTNFTVEE
jgi:hypothetical protein